MYRILSKLSEVNFHVEETLEHLFKIQIVGLLLEPFTSQQTFQAGLDERICYRFPRTKVTILSFKSKNGHSFDQGKVIYDLWIQLASAKWLDRDNMWSRKVGKYPCSTLKALFSTLYFSRLERRQKHPKPALLGAFSVTEGGAISGNLWKCTDTPQW